MSARLEAVKEVLPPSPPQPGFRLEWREYLLAWRRAIMYELQEIERQLDLNPKQT